MSITEEEKKMGLTKYCQLKSTEKMWRKIRALGLIEGTTYSIVIHRIFTEYFERLEANAGEDYKALIDGISE